jgi:large subunit ribosomal protein L21
MYAVIETGGKQYRVEVGTELPVELLDAAPGDAITLDRVLLVADGTESWIGRPLVDGAVVSAQVVRLDRADKVISFKYRPKARRRVKKGHRQEQTILRITDVVLDGRSAADAARKAATDAKTERQRVEEAAARQAAEDSALAAKLAARTAPAEDVAEPVAPKTRKTRAKAAPAAKSTAAPKTAAPKTAAPKTAVPKAPSPKTLGKTTRAKADAAEGAPAEPGDAPAPKRSRTKKDE